MLDLTSFAFALKTLYPDKKIRQLMYENNPLFAMMPKNEKFSGEDMAIPVRYADPQGRSSTFSKAQTNKGSQKGVKFKLTRKKDYSLASIDGETMEATEDNIGAFMAAVKSEFDGAFNSIVRSAAIKQYRSGTGRIGKISAASNPATDTITLDDTNDIANFEVGMVLQVSDADGGGAVRAGTVTIESLDRDAGTITATGNWTAGIAAAVAGDFIFQDGDYDAAMSGLDAWVPESAPGATLFYGVDRTVDKTRLGGVRYDGSGVSVEEALIEGVARIERHGGVISHIFVDHLQHANFVKALGSKVTRVTAKVGEIGFEGVLVHTSKGMAKVFADINCQHTVAWCLQMDTWKLHSLKRVPHILGLDKLKFLREASADSYESRTGYYGNVGNDGPGLNGRIKLAA